MTDNNQGERRQPAWPFISRPHAPVAELGEFPRIGSPSPLPDYRTEDRTSRARSRLCFARLKRQLTR